MTKYLTSRNSFFAYGAINGNLLYNTHYNACSLTAGAVSEVTCSAAVFCTMDYSDDFVQKV